MREDWEIKRLGEVIQIRNGKNQQAVISETGKYKIMGSAGNVMGYATDFICEAGTTIIGRKGNITKPIYIDERIWNVDTAFGFYPKNEAQIDKRLIYYICLGIDFESMNRGTTIPSLVKSELQTIQINYPKSLIEQQRITSILDEAFIAIAKAKANAEKNLKNAKEIFESYLQKVFENGNWEKRNLNEITEVKDGTHDSPKYIKEGIPFVTQKNIRQDGLSFSDTRFITETDHQKFYKRSNVTYGDILISMIGANRGMAAIVDDKKIFSIKNVGLIKESKNINKHFLLYYLKSSLAMRYVLYMSNGGAQEFVGLTALRSFPIPYPSLKTQQSIVAKLDTLSIETKKLEAIYQQKIKNLEELKKAILQKAFSGDLTSRLVLS